MEQFNICKILILNNLTGGGYGVIPATNPNFIIVKPYRRQTAKNGLSAFLF